MTVQEQLTAEACRQAREVPLLSPRRRAASGLSQERPCIEPSERSRRRVPSRQRAGLPAVAAAARPPIARLEAIVRAGLRARAALPPADGRAQADARRPPLARRHRGSCPSPSRPTCATPIPSACSPARWSEVVRLHASSGTTGKPIVVAYTQEDMDVWTQVMVRSFAACGLHRGDIVQNAYGYGLFTGGLARTTAPRPSAPRSSPSPAATPTARSWS